MKRVKKRLLVKHTMTKGGLVSCPRNSWAFVAIKMGRRQDGPSRTGGRSGAYLNRYATDEQRGRRPIFMATLRATASWPFFCVARSSRMNLHMLVTRALKNNQLTSGESPAISRTAPKILGIRRYTACAG